LALAEGEFFVLEMANISHFFDLLGWDLRLLTKPYFPVYYCVPYNGFPFPLATAGAKDREPA
jgi:hypothetical protein